MVDKYIFNNHSWSTSREVYLAIILRLKSFSRVAFYFRFLSCEIEHWPWAQSPCSNIDRNEVKPFVLQNASFSYFLEKKVLHRTGNKT